MQDDEFAAIGASPSFSVFHRKWPASRVTEENFARFKQQSSHRRLRSALRMHQRDHNVQQYVARHALHHETIRQIAVSIKFSPCMLARLILEHEFGWSKVTISNYFKLVTLQLVADNAASGPGDTNSNSNSSNSSTLGLPTQVQEQLSPEQEHQLRTQILECILHDESCSPLADRIRHNLGVEYEYILLETLRNRGVLFESEDALRQQGISKTPDVRLLVPIGVYDVHHVLHIVNWIDSKAMVGDHYTHETENAAQIQGYVNRFGSGMVIYWFGALASLQHDADVFVTDEFPSTVVFPGDYDPLATNSECPQQLVHHAPPPSVSSTPTGSGQQPSHTIKRFPLTQVATVTSFADDDEANDTVVVTRVAAS